MSEKDSVLIAEGKTKKIWSVPLSPNLVAIESKDDVTAGDGVRREQLEDSGKYSTETTVNCFMLLKKAGIPNHFVAKLDDQKFLAEKLTMFPREIVVRRRATGSFLKRHPEVREGTIFPDPVIEFFLKDDARHDPLIVHHFLSGKILLYNAKLPLEEGFIEELPMQDHEEAFAVKEKLSKLALQTFLVLEEAWRKQNVALPDWKGECGKTADGEIILGDVITNSEWRLWPNGDKRRQLDKQVFREMKTITPEGMAIVKANYALVAEMSRRFA